MKNLLGELPQDNFYGNRTERARLMDDENIKNKKVLDIGCGFGWCEYNLLNREVREVVALDPNNECKIALESLKSNKVKFVKGYATKLPFSSNEFDTVVCWEVIEHVPKNEETKMLNEIHRVLKPNGVLYLSTQYNNFFNTILDPAWWLVSHRHYSKKDIKEFSEKSGFKVNKIYTKGGFYTIFICAKFIPFKMDTKTITHI